MANYGFDYNFAFNISLGDGINDTNHTIVDPYLVKFQGATIISPIIFCSCGIVGNVLAIWILSRTKQEVQKTMFYTLVAGLAWTDLLGIIITTPVTLASYVNNRHLPGGQWLCNFNGFTMICFGLSTPLIVFVMAIERVMAIKYSFYYSKYCNRRVARTIIIFLWSSTITFGMFPLFGFGTFRIQYPGTWCFLDFHSFDCILASTYAYIYAFLNCITLLGMIGCNFYVIASLMELEILKSRRNSNSSLLNPIHRDSSTPLRRNSGTKTDIKKQMVYLVIVLTTIFVLCWAPLMVQIILTLSSKKVNKWMDLLAVRLASLNQTLDPWFYIILRKSCIDKIRSTVRRIFCRILRKQQPYRITMELEKLTNDELNSCYLNGNQGDKADGHEDTIEIKHKRARITVQCSADVSPDITVRLICDRS